MCSENKINIVAFLQILKESIRGTCRLFGICARKQFVKYAEMPPILANITEFGATPLYTVEELRGADVGLVLYPLSAFRAMNKAAENVYLAVRRDGTQKNVIDTMQSRMELYDRIGYHDFEQKLDALFAQQKTK